MSNSFVLKNAKYLDVLRNEFVDGDIKVIDGKIEELGKVAECNLPSRDLRGKCVVPGFIDSHLHLESSVISPIEYARAVLPRGTTSIVCDPHEIANVCGTKGIDYILDSTKELPLDVYVMIPSCVPATYVDEAGAVITSKEVEQYIDYERVLGLAEVMNYVGVVNDDPEVMAKVKVALDRGKKVDGHAPGLSGEDLKKYVAAGIMSDHECSNFGEAKEKQEAGMWIFIREGSAARNLESLMPLLRDKYMEKCTFCTDDRSPADISIDGHIDYIIRQAIFMGAKPEYAYRVASYNAAQYFGLEDRGVIAPGYIADLVILDNMKKVIIDSTYKNGYNTSKHYENSEYTNDRLCQAKNHKKDPALYNTVHVGDIKLEDFKIPGDKAKLIGMIPGEIITADRGEAMGVDLSRDIVKLAVVERHKSTGHIGLCYLNGYGLNQGAIATTVSHDSHNLIIAGTNDEDMYLAMNRMKEIGGGCIVVNDGKVLVEVAYPIAGLMTDVVAEDIDLQISLAKAKAFGQGVNRGHDPFISLGFTALPVIPSIRLTTKGVFDVGAFALL